MSSVPLMRLLVVGAGAIGGVVGARLAQAGHEVRLVARGRHGAVIASDGLRIIDPDREDTIRLPVFSSIADASVEDDDAVLSAVKTQDTLDVLDDLQRTGKERLRIVCLQNGVESERAALRRFEHVYGCMIMCPAEHLEPGVVRAFSAPVTGIFDLGRYPLGVDQLAEDLASAFSSATFRSTARGDILEAKYRKLILNLGNAIEIVCGPEQRSGDLFRVLRDEADNVFSVAGIVTTSGHDPRFALIAPRPIGGQRRRGGSSWQSVERDAGSVETDYLNGEIVLLGRLHHVPTPANELITRLAHEVADSYRLQGSLSPDAVLEMLASG